MSTLEATAIVATFLVLWQLVEIRKRLEDCLQLLGEYKIRDCVKALEKIRDEISCEYEETPSGLKLTKWGIKGMAEGIRSDLKEIYEEVSAEYEKTPSGLKLTKWGIKETVEGIRSDLQEIREEIRSK
jgi:hypothetical protein